MTTEDSLLSFQKITEQRTIGNRLSLIKRSLKTCEIFFQDEV